MDRYGFTYFNDEESQKTILTGTATPLYFLTEDCSGTGFISESAVSPNDDDGTFSIPDRSFLPERLLVKSSIFGRSWFNMQQRGCVKQEQVPVQKLLPVVEYTPPPELVNPVYPVRLEQLP